MKTNNPFLSDKTESLLQRLDFSGTDVNLDTALFEYRLVYSEKKETVIYSNYFEDLAEDTEIKFYSYDLSKKEILDAAEEMPDGFFEFIGQDKPEYLEYFHGASKISDMDAYCGKFNEMNPYYPGAWMTEDELNEFLEILEG